MQDKDELFDYISNTKKSEITLEAIRFYIRNGSNVNWTTDYGDDSLQVAAIRCLDAAVIKTLIDCGANVMDCSWPCASATGSTAPIPPSRAAWRS